MVIGPDELLKRITEDEAGKIEQLEKKIDDSLRASYEGNNSVVLDYDIFRDIRKCTVDALLSKYRQAGWSVNYISDQRDGDYYEFKRKEKGTYRDVPWA